MDTLHKSGYSIETALSSLVPASGPVLCRDEMEEWSASEANLFEEALDKYGKDFADIRQDFVSKSFCYTAYNHQRQSTFGGFKLSYGLNGKMILYDSELYQ